MSIFASSQYFYGSAWLELNILKVCFGSARAAFFAALGTSWEIPARPTPNRFIYVSKNCKYKIECLFIKVPMKREKNNADFDTIFCRQTESISWII